MTAAWLTCGLGAVALIAIVGWLRERANSRDWASLCRTYGEAYCSVAEELDKARKAPSRAQERRWLN